MSVAREQRGNNLLTEVRTLQAEVAALRSLLVPTGFVQTGPTIVVFCNLTKGNGDGWYVLEEGSTARTMPPVFQGYLDWLRIFETSGRSRNSWKFRLHLRDRVGQVYAFEAGLTSFFTRSILSMLAHAQPQQLRSVIRMQSWVREIQQGQNTGDKTLAVVVFDAWGNRMEAPWKADDDWRAIAKRADANMQAAVNRTRQGKLSDYE